MNLTELLLNEMAAEYPNTRKILERVPDDKFDWKPHAKSMSMKQLAVHLAELPSWHAIVLQTSELDFGAFEYKPTEVNNTADLLALFDRQLEKGRAALSAASEDQLLNDTWTMRHGDHIISKTSKYEMIRHAFGQNAHHRAQLGVYLRLLNIPIPGVYGPSADES
ncbi:MAG TPA: DinB family protein [Chitinophagaceae bacterium]|nr:DinB family protein [Chitinophagaceae bacterium]